MARTVHRSLPERLSDVAKIIEQLSMDAAYLEIRKTKSTGQLELPYTEVYQKKLREGLAQYQEQFSQCLHEIAQLLPSEDT